MHIFSYKLIVLDIAVMASSAQLTVEEAKSVVEDLVKKLQHGRFGLKVNEVIKAGSLGHGTAVPGHFDLDLVIYSSKVDENEIRDSENGYRKPLHNLRCFLGGIPGVNLKETKVHAVPFEYRGIDVDLLVSPNWPDLSALWTFLQDVPEKKIFDFSVSASKWQVKFFQEQSSQAKEFIKRAKAWRNKMWPQSEPGQGKPKSYLLSLLVLRAYENACERVDKSKIAQRTTAEVKEIVKNHHSANIHWDRYYHFGGGGTSYPRLYVPSDPRILDPANPTNNLYETGFIGRYAGNDKSHDYDPGDGDWTQMVDKIDTIDLTLTVEEIQRSW